MNIKNNLTKIIIIFLTITIMIQTSNAMYDTAFGTAVSTNSIPNSTRPYVYSVNLSNGVGVNNATHIFGNGRFVFNFINSTHINTNVNITVNNNTVLPIWFKKIDTNNLTSEIYVNIAVNYSQVQTYSGGANYTYNNTLGGNNVGLLFDDGEYGVIPDPIKWNTVGGSVSGGTLIVNAAGEYIDSKSTFSPGTQMEADLVYGAGGQNPYAGFSTAALGQTNFIQLQSNVYTGGKLEGRVRNSGGAVDHTGSIGNTNTFYSVKIGYLSGTANFFINGTKTSITSANVPSATVPMTFSNPVGADTLTVYWIMIRPYVSPEPLWSTWNDMTDLTLIVPVITVINNSKTKTNNPYKIFLNNSESITFYVNTTNPYNTWNWYVDGVLISNNYNSYTTSWSSGTYHHVYVNATNSIGTSNTVFWGINVFPAMASSPGNNIPMLNETPASDFERAIVNADFPATVNAPIEVYVNLIGLTFYAVVWFIVFGMQWIKQASINVPAVVGVIFGGIIIAFLPAQYQLVSQVLIVFGIFAVIYIFYKGRG